MKQTLKDLLYNPKRDGDSAESFHKCCDNKGPLLFLIKTKEGKNLEYIFQNHGNPTVTLILIQLK